MNVRNDVWSPTDAPGLWFVLVVCFWLTAMPSQSERSQSVPAFQPAEHLADVGTHSSFAMSFPSMQCGSLDSVY
jgi:hypothetical protein